MLQRVLGVTALVCLLGFLFCTDASAQSQEGRFLGTVTDSQGKVVVGAKIAITNTGTGVTRNLASNGVGDYTAPAMQPGLYSLSAEAPGFKRIERTSIRLEVGTDVRIDFQLIPGAVTETVRVTAEQPLITTTNDAIGGSLSNKEINDLPLNGRDYQNLLVLRPGVVRFPGGGFESISSSGMRPEDNNFILDGTDDNDPYYSGNIINAEGVQGTPGSILPIDAIQEFNSEENPSPEYGWKPGATINIGLKSGTNTVHGTAYGFERNNWFDARNWFNTKPDPQVALRQHQFGGTVGGPIIHDKTFFFLAYEGVRGFISNAATVFSPATTTLGGDPANSIPDAIADLTLHGVAVNPLSANLIGTGTFKGNGLFPGLFPVNNGTNPLGVTAVSTGFPNVNRSDTGVAKVDHHFSPTQALSAHYLIGDSNQIEQDFTILQPQWRSTSMIRAQVFGISLASTPNGNWVNEARFGFSNFWQKIQAVDNAANPLTTYGLNTGVTNPLNFGLPEIDIGNFTQLGNASGWPLFTTPNRTIQFSDGVSYTRGAHTFKFGGEVRRGSTDNVRNRAGKGRIEFDGGNIPGFPTSSPLEDFLAGFPGTGRIFVGDSQRKVHLWSFGWYVADDWRVTPRLSVNLGLRYELNTVIKEDHNLLGNFDPAIGFQQVGVNISSPYNGDHNNFAPRVGVAWDPWGTGKTVFRAGAGINYEIPHLSLFIGQNGVDCCTTPGLNDIPTGAIGSNIPGNILATGLTVSPTYQDINTPIFPVATATLNCNSAQDPVNPGTPCDILGVTRHLRTPYVVSWNANIQRALGSTTSIQIGYVGNTGIKLYSVRDINQVNVANDFRADEQSGRPFTFNCPAPIGMGAGGPCFPFLGFVNFLQNGYHSTFNSLQVTATQRVWHGLNFLAGYTYAHSIDDATNNRSLSPQNSLRPDLERASSDFDIRHRFTLALTYALPSVKSFAQLLEGWQINSIVTLQGATPYSVVDGIQVGSDVSLTGEFTDRWDFFGNPKDFKAIPSGIPFFAGASNPACAAQALSVDGGVVNGPTSQALASLGCYASGNSLMIPPAFGTFGTMGRNLFRGPNFHNWDFSLVKDTRLSERVRMQIRAEFFNILNHPQFANPEAILLLNEDPSVPGAFGASSATPDVGAANPVIGTGGPRNIQLGLKFIF
jgi:hypothetical protein